MAVRVDFNVTLLEFVILAKMLQLHGLGLLHHLAFSVTSFRLVVVALLKAQKTSSLSRGIPQLADLANLFRSLVIGPIGKDAMFSAISQDRSVHDRVSTREC